MNADQDITVLIWTLVCVGHVSWLIDVFFIVNKLQYKMALKIVLVIPRRPLVCEAGGYSDQQFHNVRPSICVYVWLYVCM